jgi:prephenate dehydrogenase
VLLLAEVGSVVVAVTEELAVIVPAATEGATFTTTIMPAEVPAASAGSVQFTVPVPPTAGVVQVQPAGARTDWNVVLVGVASVKLAPAAAAGPLFVTVCV